MPRAWELQTGDGNIVVAVIDTGVDYNHPDLKLNIWRNPREIPDNGEDDDGNGYIDDVRGWDFGDSDNDPIDSGYHGTHVAGIIGASGNNGYGVAGLNWEVSIMPLKIEGRNDWDWAAAKAIRYAARMGAKVINASWRLSDYSDSTLELLQETIKQSGCLFVASAGNEGENNDKVAHYPSNFALDNVLAVAASDQNDRLASEYVIFGFNIFGLSNYGATTVHVTAPGKDIYSTFSYTDDGVEEDDFRSASGTSMAAPHVSGLAALVLAENPSLSATEAKRIIVSNVDYVSALQGKTVTGGRINAYKAIFWSVVKPTITVGLTVSPSGPYQLGQSVTAAYTMTNRGRAPITLDVLTVGGRDPDGDVADFSWQRNLTLGPKESHNYTGSLRLWKAGKYHFFCAYRPIGGDWVTSVELAPGLTDDDRIEDIEVLAPDLTVTSVNAPVTAKVGDYIAVSWTVKNIGDAPSGAFFNRVSLSTQPYGTHLLLGTFAMASIAPGLSSSDAQIVKIPETAASGYYYVTVYADVYKSTVEGREDNNIEKAPNQIRIVSDVPVDPVTDTIPGKVSIASPVGGENWLAGSQQAIRWTATDDVGVHHIDLYYTTDAWVSPGKAIETRLANTGSYSWTVPNVSTEKAAVCVLAFDEAGNGWEAYSGLFRILTEPSYPDPLISSISVDDCAPDVGQNVTVTVAVANHGKVASVPTSVRYYFSTTGEESSVSAWPMFQHDAKHTGRSWHCLQGDVSQKWSYELGAVNPNCVLSSFQPVIGPEGVIYIGLGEVQDEADAAWGKVYAFDSDGALKWEFSGLEGPPRFITIGAYGTLYVSSDSGLYALSPAGQRVWHFYEEDMVNLSAVVIGSSGEVYFTGYSLIYCLNVDGSLRWRKGGVPRGGSASGGPVIGPDGTVYAVWTGFITLTDGARGMLCAYNPQDGAVKWALSLEYAAGLQRSAKTGRFT